MKEDRDSDIDRIYIKRYRESTTNEWIQVNTKYKTKTTKAFKIGLVLLFKSGRALSLQHIS